MENRIKISVLVPVYRVESYLQRCIDSVVTQDFQDWEMILVDDGSPDRCPEICDEASKKDPRISVVHKENGGLPSARLAGFEHARGEYLVFLDSDDWLMDGALAILYRYAEGGDYDVVRAGNRRVKDDGTFTEETSIKLGKTIGAEKCLVNVITIKFLPYLWGAIYRRELFTKEIFERVRSFSVGEDWLTNIAVAKRCRKVLCVSDIVYNYFINVNSIMQTKVCSHEYGVRLQKYLYEMTCDSPESVKFAAKVNLTKGCIGDLFIAELPFRKENYKIIKTNLNDNSIREEVYNTMNRRYLHFIDCPPVYRLYTRLYCLLFFIVKLKGRKRQVIQ